MSTPTPEERAADLRQNGFLWKDDAVERYVAGVIAEAERAGAERMRDALDPDALRAAGWVRADDVRRRVDIARDDCARYLELVVGTHESEQVPLDAGALRRVAEQLRGGTP
jgi:hypothetical protein